VQPLALLLADLGVHKTHSRPHTSDDNPFSEAQFKTLKYRPGFPDRFGSIEDARAFCVDFFDWYNNDHHHDGIARFTPHDVHCGLVEQRLSERQAVMNAAYLAHPERFPNGPPTVARPPTAVWINPPKARPLLPRSESPCEVSELEAKAREALKQATRVLYKAINSGTLHRNTVRRKVARLSASLHRKFGKKA